MGAPTKFESDRRGWKMNEYGEIVPRSVASVSPDIVDIWQKQVDAAGSPNHRRRSNMTRDMARGRINRNSR